MDEPHSSHTRRPASLLADPAARRVIIAAAAALLLAVVLVPLCMLAMMLRMMTRLTGELPLQQMLAGGPAWPLFVVPLLAVAAVVLLGVWIDRLIARRVAGQEPPLELLQRRYASGEISREEYERVRADLLRDRHV